MWKAVNQLKAEGYQVEAVRNRGYHIMDSPDILTREELGSLMDTEWAGRKIYYFDEIDSTNMRAKQLGERGHPRGSGYCRRAECRERKAGRAWESPEAAAYICPYF